jgi:hypothetical protein
MATGRDAVIDVTGHLYAPVAKPFRFLLAAKAVQVGRYTISRMAMVEFHPP